jgi:hypothetical protein
MSLNTSGLVNAIASHAAATGLFDVVNSHEPKNAPNSHLSCAIWAQSLNPVLSSGLAAASARVEFRVRLYTAMLQEPADMIDPELLDAVDVLMADYIGNFTLGGIIRDVDVLGSDGAMLSVVAGYLSQDGKLFRIMDITLPLVINDLWTESP